MTPRQPVRADKVAKKEEQFVREYFAAQQNATLAYQRTYGTANVVTARTNAARMLCRAHVRAAIIATRKRLRTGTTVKPEHVVGELAKIAFADIGDVIDLDAAIPGLRKSMRPEARQAIAGIEIDVLPAPGKGKKKRVKTKVKMHDKLKALDKLGGMLGLYEDPVPLDQLLASLPPRLADLVRFSLAAALRQGGGGEPVATDAPAPRTAVAELGEAAPDSGRGVPGGGAHSGPVAGGVPGGPSLAANDPGVPAGGEDVRGSGEDLGALFDDS